MAIRSPGHGSGDGRVLDCTSDGDPLYGGVGIVVPVLRKTTEPAVLKVSFLIPRTGSSRTRSRPGAGAERSCCTCGTTTGSPCSWRRAPHDAGRGRAGRRGGGDRGERLPSPRRPRACRAAPASRPGRRVGRATTPGRPGLPRCSAVLDGAGRDGDGARARAPPAGHPHPRRLERAEHPGWPSTRRAGWATGRTTAAR